MLYWLPNVLLAKQAAKIALIRLNALSRWHAVSSGHSTVLLVDLVAPVNIDCLPAEYCFESSFPFLIPTRDDWSYDAIVPPERP